VSISEPTAIRMVNGVADMIKRARDNTHLVATCLFGFDDRTMACVIAAFNQVCQDEIRWAHLSYLEGGF